MTRVEKAEALSRAAAGSLERVQEDQHRVKPALAAVLAHIAASAFDPTFQLKDLAQGHGQRWLWRRFKAELGGTPKSYVETLRLQTAQRLLDAAEPPVYEVAEWVGYRSTETFIRAFTAWAKLTPRAYRRRRLAEKTALTVTQTHGGPPTPALPTAAPPAGAEHEKRLLEALAPHLLSWTSTERRALATHGYQPSRRAIFLALLEESRENCRDDPGMGLDLVEDALDVLEDIREESAAEDLAQLEALAMTCLRQQERRRKSLTADRARAASALGNDC